MELKFYHCRHCGNIAVKPFDSGVPLVCCGEQMEELVANTTDAALEKHVPDVKVDGSNVHVQVGSTLHPMTPEHYITFVCLQDVYKRQGRHRAVRGHEEAGPGGRRRRCQQVRHALRERCLLYTSSCV